MVEQGYTDRMLQTRSGLLDTKTFPGGTVIGNDNVQRMTVVWMWSMEKNTRTKEIRASQAF